MRIKTLWGMRRDEKTPELMEAWDYFSIDSNPDGWIAACEKAITSWGDDLITFRYICLDVNDAELEEAFAEPTIEVTRE